MKLHSAWSFHPAIKRPEGARFGDWAADKVRNGMGSWLFVFGSLSLIFVWMFANGTDGFDPFPFILLNLVLSCVAALQGSILLIAARREDQISSNLARYTLEIDRKNLELTEQIERLVKEIHADTLRRGETA